MSDEQEIEVGDLVWSRLGSQCGPGIVLKFSFDIIDGKKISARVFHPNAAAYGPQILKWFVTDLSKKPSVLA